MKIPVTNNTAMPMYVASIMIPPGETMHIEEGFVDPHLRPAKEETPPEEAPAADPFALLLEHKTADIVAALATMETSEVEKLGELEQQGQARKGVLSAIAEELLKRAEGKQPSPSAPLPEGEGS